MLATGDRLGPFEIVARLGAGGMGEVWRARDPRLGRDVAVKMLSARFASDPARLAGFGREAKALAALNHPNIAAIYGIEEAQGRRALVMELVEGPTLAARLRVGPMSLEDALAVARQIADAIESAHEKGVVHRDLKPANVKLRPDGTVKVLDFGLAKFSDAGSQPEPEPGAEPPAGADEPVVSAHFTVLLPSGAEGAIAGTAAYMSPEQAKGKRVDARSDIWSFGVVLYEMLTGRRPFSAPSSAETIVQVLQSTPDWSLLPVATPVRVRNLLRRCLTRDPRQRLQAIGDARVILDEVIGGKAEDGSVLQPSGDHPLAGQEPGARRFPWRHGVLAAALGLVALLAGWAWWRGWGGFERTRAARPVRFEVALPPGERLVGAPPAFAPDGRSFAFLTQSLAGGKTTLRVQGIDAFTSFAVTEPQEVTAAFWSPDSRWLGYIVPGAIRKLNVAAGTSETICKCADLGRGGSWGPDGTILFAPNPNSAIYRVPASGGDPVAVTSLESAAADISHRFPEFLPDGRHFVFTVWSNSREVLDRDGGVFVGSLDDRRVRRLSAEVSSVQFLPPHHLLAYREGALVALPLDLETREIEGEPILISDRVAFAPTTGALLASASRRGDVLFATQWRAEIADLRWVGRDGTPGEEVGRWLETNGDDLRISPDGTRYAFTRVETASGQLDIWVADFASGTMSRVTHGETDSLWPVWAADGTRLAFTNRDSGEEDVYVRVADATTPPERVYISREQDTRPTDWSRDGRHLLFDATDKRGGARWEVRLLDLRSRAARVLLSDDAVHHRGAVFSPDGRWIAYASDESGRYEVYVRPFPGLDRKWQLSQQGGTAPRWRRDGREVVFRGGDSAPWAVPISPDDRQPRPGTPQRLFAARSAVSGFDVSADHGRFLFAVVPPAETIHLEPLRVLLDWRPPSS